MPFVICCRGVVGCCKETNDVLVLYQYVRRTVLRRKDHYGRSDVRDLARFAASDDLRRTKKCQHLLLLLFQHLHRETSFLRPLY